MRIRTRLSLSHAALTAVGALLVAVCAFWSFRGYVYDSTREDLAARATAVAANVEDWLERGDLDRVRLIVRRYGAQEDVWLRVISPDGQLVATANPEEESQRIDWRSLPGVREAIAGHAASGNSTGLGGHDDRLYECRPLVRRGHLYGVLRMSRTLASFSAQQRRTAITITGIVVAVLALCTLVSVWIAKRLGTPVQRMRDFAVGVGLGRAVERLDESGRDEIGELAAAMNAMKARLDALDDERRAFLAKASHELRTPLTNVSATLEALEGGASDDPALRERFLRTALGEVRRMTSLVQSLLDLGRLEAGVTEIERRPMELAQLVERTTQPLLARFDAAGVKLEIEPAEAWCDGDPERLQQALLNVMDNALRHSNPGSAVRVRLRPTHREVAIEVKDGGNGFDPAVLPHVFEQFFAANQGDARGGAGLGLAIAQRIIQRHGGSIDASNASEGGALVTITLPTSSKPH
jgi:signal transduction histidine kinase